ncbi:MAG: glycerophosphodiester phosphodiesterase family protein [Candidatus Hydrogenedentes bacterium]|nr:glycerophosphodiester phosphodiesterase family protein [Candidatus Hydrogenedentota bacterium]
MRARLLPCALALAAAALTVWAADPCPRLERPPRQGGVHVIAHRGAHAGIPENTISAYEKAIELGADFVEVDLRTTKDGRIVSMHNDTVDSYAKGAKGKVADFTLAELKALDIGSRVGPEWAETRIPTFEEILEVCRGRIGIYVDLKAADPAVVAGMLRKAGMAEDAVWYAGAGQLRKLRDACAECLPMPDPGDEKNLPRVVSLLSPSVVASSWDNLTPGLVARTHEAGALLFVDDGGPETWEKMLSMGVDGIQTDEVEDLVALLRQRGR